MPESLLTCYIWNTQFFMRNALPCKKRIFPTLARVVSYPMDLLVWKNGAYNIMTFEEASSRYIGINYQEFISLRLVLSQSFQKHRVNVDTLRISLPSQPILHSIISMSKKGCRQQGFPARERIWEKNLGKLKTYSFGTGDIKM